MRSTRRDADWKTLNRKILFFTWLIGILLAFLPWMGRSEEFPARGERVILITLDGVRWQEIFQGVDPRLAFETSNLEHPMPWLSSEGRSQGLLLGGQAPDSDAPELPLVVSNPFNLSLPAYQTIFTGRVQPRCSSNRCGYVTEETLQERIYREFPLEPFSAATIGSWEKIRHAAERPNSSSISKAFVNVEHEPLDDDSPHEAALRDALNAREKKDRPPWFNSRRDALTWAQALRFWRVHHPRLLVISLVDSDEWGHLGRYRRYLRSLHQYDAWIQDLVQQLENDPSGHGRKTTLIITTDHGRGSGSEWTRHGRNVEGSHRIWLYVRPGSASKFRGRWDTGQMTLDAEPHRSLRPTIETLLGLCPTVQPGGGRPWLHPFPR